MFVCLTVCMPGFKFIRLFVFQSLYVDRCLSLLVCIGLRLFVCLSAENIICLCLIFMSVCHQVMLATLCFSSCVYLSISQCLSVCACVSELGGPGVAVLPLCMWVYVHAFMCVCTYVCTCACTCVYVRIYMQSVCGSVFMGMAFVETVSQSVFPVLGGWVLTDQQVGMPGSLHKPTFSLGIFQAMTTWWCLSPRSLRLHSLRMEPSSYVLLWDLG